MSWACGTAASPSSASWRSGPSALAALTRPAGAPADVLPSLAGTAAGVLALLALLAPLATAPASTSPAASEPVDQQFVGRLGEVLASGDRNGAGLDRRRFFLTGAAAVGVAAVSGGSGRLLQRSTEVASLRAGITLPTPSRRPPPCPRASTPGAEPVLTPNGDFYRVDTALIVPRGPAEAGGCGSTAWSTARSTLDFEQLLARPMIERDITLTCVSNEVGGRYVGNARWLGVPLADLLREAGVRARRRPDRVAGRRRLDGRHADRGRARRPGRDARRRR